MKTSRFATSNSPSLATLGNSRHAEQARAQVEQLSRHDEFALIFGPEGAGKESLARSIHAASSRASKPFVVLNCKLLSAGNFFDSQVFGHLPGAFAGLPTSSLGLIQAAHGGTIYLSGVESLELESQWKLFRTLEDQTVVPLGGSEGIPVDVRAIASTSIDLPLGVEVGMFRGDFFQMLSANLVELNGLVDRLEDVPVLAEEIVRESASSRKLPAKRFSASAVEWLGRYEWPGNLNELRKAIDMAATCESDEIDARSLRLALKKVNLPSATFRRRSPNVRFTGFMAMRSSIAARCHA